MNAYVNQLIDQHNDGVLELSTEAHGYQILDVRVSNRADRLNLPAYRYNVRVTARWMDDAARRPLVEAFDGWGPTWGLAETQAVEQYNRWRMKLNRIGGAS